MEFAQAQPMKMLQRRQNYLGCERQGGYHCPRRNSAVIRAKGSAACQVVIKAPLDAVDSPGLIARTSTRCHTPAKRPIFGKPHGVADGVFLLNKGGASAILEIVTVMISHEGIGNPTEIDPHVRHLMRKQRAGIEAVHPVDGFPLIRRNPCTV